MGLVEKPGEEWWRADSSDEDDVETPDVQTPTGGHSLARPVMAAHDEHVHENETFLGKGATEKQYAAPKSSLVTRVIVCVLALFAAVALLGSLTMVDQMAGTGGGGAEPNKTRPVGEPSPEADGASSSMSHVEHEPGHDSPPPSAQALPTTLLNRREIKEGPCPSKAEWKWFSSMPRPEKCWDMSLFYIKGPKTGSSTLGGVARRIAAHYGLNCVGCNITNATAANEPRVIANHIPVETLRQVLATQQKDLFTWTFARDPAERCLSMFYHFRVTRNGVEPTDENIIAFATLACKDFLWKYYDLGNPETSSKMDFIGVNERMQESLVALAHYLGLSMGDILYIPSKVSTSKVRDVTFEDVNLRLVPHVPLTKQSAGVRRYFATAFAAANQNDYKLIRDANARLDADIKTIGKARFQRQVALFRKHLKAATAACTVYGADGFLQKGTVCYWADNGCGVLCLDQYATEHNLWTPLSQL